MAAWGIDEDDDDIRVTADRASVNGVSYSVGDFVYLASEETGAPFDIGRITKFYPNGPPDADDHDDASEVKSKDGTNGAGAARTGASRAGDSGSGSNEEEEDEGPAMGVNWFMRIGEVDANEAIVARMEQGLGMRELVQTEVIDVNPVGALRGKCRVRHVGDIDEPLTNYAQREDSFFYEFKRPALTAALTRADPSDDGISRPLGAAMRIGADYQAVIPKLAHNRDADAFRRAREVQGELLFSATRCALTPEELDSYLSAARATVLTNQRIAHVQSSITGYSVPPSSFPVAANVVSDGNRAHLHSLSLLTSNGYDPAAALAEHAGCVRDVETVDVWDDSSRVLFDAGVAEYGKRLDKIQRRVLSHRSIGHVVGYYYIWKRRSRLYGECVKREGRKTAIVPRIRGLEAHDSHGADGGTRAAGNGTPAQHVTAQNVESHLVNDSVDVEPVSDSSEDLSHGGKRRMRCANVDCRSKVAASYHMMSYWGCVLCRECRAHWKKYGAIPLRGGGVNEKKRASGGAPRREKRLGLAH